MYATLLWPSGLSILLHDVISLKDATSYDKREMCKNALISSLFLPYSTVYLLSRFIYIYINTMTIVIMLNHLCMFTTGTHTTRKI